MELFRALCAVAEDHAFVSAAHPLYAGLMERTLSKVVLVHVAGLERLCQVRLLRPHTAGSGAPFGLASLCNHVAVKSYLLVSPEYMLQCNVHEVRDWEELI